jgi:hypothetical protein
MCIYLLPWLGTNGLIYPFVLPFHPRAGTYFAISDAYATASFERCNLGSDVSTLAAIANAAADFATCTLGVRTNRTRCTADQTATMLAAHSLIAAARGACNACAYPTSPLSSRPDPPKVRFNSAAEIAYNANVNVFVAAAFTRCNIAAWGSSVAAVADTDGDLTAAYTGICAVRTACIIAGNQPASALPTAHLGELPI